MSHPQETPLCARDGAQGRDLGCGKGSGSGLEPSWDLLLLVQRFGMGRDLVRRERSGAGRGFRGEEGNRSEP